MKLVVAIVQDYDTDALLHAATGSGLRATRLASTGGFLRTGNTTVLLGVQDEEVATCLDVISRTCHARTHRPNVGLAVDVAEWAATGISEVRIGGAVVFVLAVARFVRFPSHRRKDTDG